MKAISLDLKISEFDTSEQVTSYDLWFCSKVQKSIESIEPRIPHDEAMARLELMLQETR